MFFIKKPHTDDVDRRYNSHLQNGELTAVVWTLSFHEDQI